MLVKPTNNFNRAFGIDQNKTYEATKINTNDKLVTYEGICTVIVESFKFSFWQINNVNYSLDDFKEVSQP